MLPCHSHSRQLFSIHSRSCLLPLAYILLSCSTYSSSGVSRHKTRSRRQFNISFCISNIKVMPRRAYNPSGPQFPTGYCCPDCDKVLHRPEYLRTHIDECHPHRSASLRPIDRSAGRTTDRYDVQAFRDTSEIQASQRTTSRFQPVASRDPRADDYYSTSSRDQSSRSDDHYDTFSSGHPEIYRNDYPDSISTRNAGSGYGYPLGSSSLGYGSRTSSSARDYDNGFSALSSRRGYGYDDPISSFNQAYGYGNRIPSSARDYGNGFSALSSTQGYGYDDPIPSSNQACGYGSRIPSSARDYGNGFSALSSTQAYGYEQDHRYAGEPAQYYDTGSSSYNYGYDDYGNDAPRYSRC